jgi:lysyl-tRNA synthetase class 2
LSTPRDKFEADRLQKLQQIEQLGLDPWGGRFDGHTAIAKIRALPVPTGEPMSGPPVRAAGRIMSMRKMGKIRFLDLADMTGRIQVMAGQKQVGDQGWALSENLDLGDLLGVDGRFAATKTGELTIFAEQLHFLAKSLQPHPDKWGGIEDIEYALRHRYLDLIYNTELRDKALKRIRIIQFIREYLNARGYHEVETPVLHAVAGGAAARPFITHHNALDIDLYLRIALELHLKRLLVAGIEKVYEIGRVFRNEGISPRHNPEFSMLELYQAYGDYHTMMDLTEGLIVGCVEMLGQGMCLPYGDHTIDFTPPWRRARYAELFAEHVGVRMDDTPGLLRVAERMNFATAGKHPDVVIHFLFEAIVEDHLAGPIFVHDYPASLCPLTKRKRGQDNVAERFELYVRSMELANAYTELNDPQTQELTFRTQLAGMPEEESMARMDEDFIRALRYGMPPAGGLGIGIDRLVMLLTNSQTIRDVILFPLLRPEKLSAQGPPPTDNPAG